MKISKNPEVIEHATNPNTSKEYLRKLSKEGNKEILIYISDNPNTPKETLEELSKSDNNAVRFGVAENENTPEHILEKLAEDEAWGVIRCVAKNPNTAQNTLKSIYRKAITKNFFSRNSIMTSLSLHKNTPEEILLKIVENEGLFVRMKIAENNFLPKFILKKLALDKTKVVRNALYKNSNVDKEIKEIVESTNKLYEYLG